MNARCLLLYVNSFIEHLPQKNLNDTPYRDIDNCFVFVCMYGSDYNMRRAETVQATFPVQMQST